ncbi:MAG: RNase adapter RapZ [Acidimicrobiales bacterium]|nr:RNase adapter RapZ [Acidimicrobiales bacterium]
MTEFVVITGMSGAGRSTAAKDLEDLGWFVIDNLPSELMPKVVELVLQPGTTTPRVALVVGAGAYESSLLVGLAELRTSGGRVRQLFLDAETAVLVRRYESSRRRHPLLSAGEGLADAIERERALLEPVKAEADVVVDTTSLNVHELRARVADLFGEDDPSIGMQTRVMSFGYKHGLPLDVDLVIDCRFLPNPHWVEKLRPQTGLHDDVRRYVLEQPAAAEFLERLDGLLGLLLPAYVAEGKSYLSLALGCTGGRHRSVAIAEVVADQLRARGFGPTVIHRDITK